MDKKISGSQSRFRNTHIKFNALIIALAFLTGALCLLLGSGINSQIEVVVGLPSPKRFQAAENTIDTAGTNRLRREAEDRARANIIYMQDSTVTQGVLDGLDEFFNEIGLMRIAFTPLVGPSGTVEPAQISDLDRAKLSVDLSSTHLTFLVSSGSAVYMYFKDTVTDITKNALFSGIREDGLARAYVAARDEINLIDEWDNIVKNAAYSIVSQVLKPNLVVDHESILNAVESAADAVEPVYFQKGQNIVAEGDPITPEIYETLEALGLIGQSLADSLVRISGMLGLISITLGASIAYLAYSFPQKFTERRNVLLLFTLYAAALLLAWLLQGVHFIITPILAFTLLTAMLMDTQLAIVFNLCITVMSSVLYNGDIKYVAFFLSNGVIAALLAKRLTVRSKMLSSTIILSLSGAAAALASYLVFSSAPPKDMFDAASFAALAAVFTVIICVGSLPFFETVYGIVTSIKLADLSNPNNPLLRRLIIEAPGTYHHSLIVANLAETAAYDVGANPVLARVGGYYHDIGKLTYPQYFVENQIDVNPHNSMDPYLSAKIIIEHVDKGLELADEYKLPKAVRSFIEEHHGSSMAKYFYMKAKNANPGVEIDEKPFRYNHNEPQSPETAIVMMADTVEAAVRSMVPNGKPMSEVEAFVRGLIKDALNLGRLRDSRLTIKDMDTIAEAFMRVIRGMYHERIEYPSSTSPSGEKKAGT